MAPEKPENADYNPLNPEMEAQMRRRRLEARERRSQEPNTSGRGQFGSWKLAEEIGQGAAGMVHRVQSFAGEARALKILRGSVVATEERRGARETALRDLVPRLVALDHPHLVRIHGLAEDSGRVGLVMDWIEGPSLDAVLREHGPMAYTPALDLLDEIASGLGALHGAGVLHGDIKVRNVMLREGLGAVLMDAGSARHDGSTRSDRAIALAGTPQSMAPEILAGEAATAASDLYSLGVVFFFVLTGKLPVKGPMIAQLREAHSRGSSPRPSSLRPGLPVCLDELAASLLAVDPNQRITDVASLRAAIVETRTRLEAGDESSPSRWGRLWRALPAPSRPLVALALVALLIYLISLFSE